jgi:hypothetical protein
MKCAKCGNETPQGAEQCPTCGGKEFIEAQVRQGTKPIVYVIAGLAAVIIIALVVAVIAGGRKNVATAPPPSAGPANNVVTAPPPAPAGGNLVTAPPANPAPATTLPGAAKPKPPAEVVEYLEFVKKVEEHRQMLLKDTTDALTLAGVSQAQSLMALIDMASNPDSRQVQDPLADTRKELIRQQKNWVSTLQYFDKKTAPTECREFSGAYRDVLYKEAKAITDIAESFSKVNITDPKDMQGLLTALQRMKKDSSIQGGIDASADNADAKLTQLVSKYDMQKPFNVPREERTSGSIMGF